MGGTVAVDLNLQQRGGAGDARVGTEIANAWGWLLNRAPRIARALNDMPGGPSMMARVLAGVDLYIRRHGIRDNRRAMSTLDFEVTYQPNPDAIVIKISHR
jgi:hypothetical protein